MTCQQNEVIILDYIRANNILKYLTTFSCRCGCRYHCSLCNRRCLYLQGRNTNINVTFNKHPLNIKQETDINENKDINIYDDDDNKQDISNSSINIYSIETILNEVNNEEYHNIVEDSSINSNSDDNKIYDKKHPALKMIDMICSWNYQDKHNEGDNVFINNNSLDKNNKISRNMKHTNINSNNLNKKNILAYPSPLIFKEKDSNIKSTTKSSIMGTRASIALPEQYYIVPKAESLQRSILKKLDKYIKKIFGNSCEIQRIINSEPLYPYLVEKYIVRSRNINIDELISISDLLIYIVDDSYLDKCIDLIISSKFDRIIDRINFRKKLKLNLIYIQYATKSRSFINNLARINFSLNLEDHNMLLNQLWECYYPNKSQIKWEVLGFQQSDPSSDFRGVGILALICLLYFSLAHSAESKLIHDECSNSKYWYSFAVTGINITSWLRDWLNQRDSRIIPFFYTAKNNKDTITIFCELFSYIFLKFHHFWMNQKPKSVLQFPFIAKKFKDNLKFPKPNNIYYNSFQNLKDGKNM
ncbi:ELMO CED-12 family protein [Cryptosporidium andersoni]|uniref:ELMO CED-12 family protein n=1 Tax=Cryptosporidium andersoni TaxID=117008 RepID=A0A1J4MRP6_9CRYT|nr:ELMO CED-12 family protein [Cryptosporidium andersoni]